MTLVRREEVETIVSETKPQDGFRVREAVFAGQHSLHLGFYQNGVPVRPPWLGEDEGPLVEVWRKQDPTDTDYGEKVRLRLVLESLCRYLNTGGDWAKLADAMTQLVKTAGGGVRVAAIPGFHLIDSTVNTEGVYEHLFAAADSPWAVRWVEDAFLDVVKLADVQREQQTQDEEHELRRGTPTPVYGPTDGECPGADLPRLQGPNPAEPDAGGPE